ncbi:MAG TPA: DUF465 domain-containing protein [Rhizomicrobium sp.]
MTGAGFGVLIVKHFQQRGARMALQGHIQELSEKHKKLEELIEVEMAHPDWDELRVACLKKEKLRIKDELLKLQGPVH